MKYRLILFKLSLKRTARNTKWFIRWCIWENICWYARHIKYFIEDIIYYIWGIKVVVIVAYEIARRYPNYSDERATRLAHKFLDIYFDS